MSNTPLSDSLNRAFEARRGLIETLHSQDTDCYRLFHGAAEGAPGLSVDRYGEVLLVQSFHQPLSTEELATLRDFYRQATPGQPLIYNDRSHSSSRIGNELDEAERTLAEAPRVVREMGTAYSFRARHAGQDPWLFLDLRAGRRRVAQEAVGKSLLNLFAYTCGVGISAARAGARFVVNVDFSESALKVGRDNARLNELPFRPRFVHSDVFPALRQYAGIGQPRRVRGKRMPSFPELAPQQFEVVFLDPPRYAKSQFGVVDLVNDYPSVFKPALLATAEGGSLICTNNVASVARDEWLDQLERSARKAGREVRGVEWIAPDADFPSHDGNPPLKMVLLRV